MPETRVPLLRCLKCFEESEKWAELLNGLDQIQKESGGDSLSIPDEVFNMQNGYIDAPDDAEDQIQKTNKEISSNSDIKARLK